MTYSALDTSLVDDLVEYPREIFPSVRALDVSECKESRPQDETAGVITAHNEMCCGSQI